MQNKDQLLRTAHGECRNNNAPASITHPIDRGSELNFHRAHILVKTIAVSAFHYQVVALRARFRIGDYGQSRTPHIAGENEAGPPTCFLQMQ